MNKGLPHHSFFKEHGINWREEGEKD